MSEINRKEFIRQAGMLGSAFVFMPYVFSEGFKAQNLSGIDIKDIMTGEDVFAYISRVYKRFDVTIYREILGAANAFKEGDEIAGLAARSETSRDFARQLLSHTKIGDIHKHDVYNDEQYKWIRASVTVNKALEEWTLGDLKTFILSSDEIAIKNILPSLESDVISMLVKLMSNQELIQASSKIFNPLPDSKIGSKGYMSARVQPNSPTDDPEDIIWQVFNAWSYAVGDLLLGCNPVSSEVPSVLAIEKALLDLRKTFKLEEQMAHSVLAHIDVQAEAEKLEEGSTGVWFQSIAGTDSANTTFDLSIEKLKQHLKNRKGKFGLYAETGQGADGTNGHSEGFDMVMHESRKYGLIRCLKQYLTEVNEGKEPWVFVNDVAGFIGPEVFKNKEQLVRCCLEDTLMGKLHGLCIGLDICTTLHMDVTLDDLDWCIDEIMPANPAYLMALPTKNDPMLSYLTTSFSNHLKIREKFNYKINDAMWEFFKRLEVIDSNNQPGKHFGNPLWIWYNYKLLKGDTRDQAMIILEGREMIERVKKRGVPISEGYGQSFSDAPEALNAETKRLYEDAKACLWTDIDTGFVKGLSVVELKTKSIDRKDYVYHPFSGEELDADSIKKLKKFSQTLSGEISPDVQIVISDGLNARALMDEGHLLPFLEALKLQLNKQGFKTSEKHLFIKHGRVRAGYRCGEQLFSGNTDNKKSVLHIIGERPGNGHRTFSVYLTKQTEKQWQERKTDHNVTRVVSGISDTTLLPETATELVVDILKSL
jgi:ethanolamine ammonia-lyase large subunit